MKLRCFLFSLGLITLALFHWSKEKEFKCKSKLYGEKYLVKNSQYLILFCVKNKSKSISWYLLPILTILFSR